MSCHMSGSFLKPQASTQDLKMHTTTHVTVGMPDQKTKAKKLRTFAYEAILYL